MISKTVEAFALGFSISQYLVHSSLKCQALRNGSPRIRLKTQARNISSGLSAATRETYVNATGLRIALWRCALGAELPRLAETCRSIGVHFYLVVRSILHSLSLRRPAQ